MPRSSSSRRVTMLKAAAVPALLSMLALGACGAPKFPAGNDHDGNITQRSVEKPTDMATTAEMTNSTPNSEIYPPTPAPAPIGAAYPRPLSYSSSYPVTASRIGGSDSAFVEQAMSLSATEVALARIAYVRARSADVRNFARQMLVDHRLTATELDNFALERGYLVDWPLTVEDRAAIDRLRVADAAYFDRAYIDETVRTHERTVALLQGQSTGSGQAAAMARNALPGAQNGLAMARSLQVRL